MGNVTGGKKVQTQYEKEITDFKLLQRIGGGSFGTVYLGQLRENDKEFYAIKAMSKAEMVKSDMVEMAVLEKDIMLTNKHPNLITMHWVFQT